MGVASSNLKPIRESGDPDPKIIKKEKKKDDDRGDEPAIFTFGFNIPVNDDPAARFSANGFSYESEFTDAQCMVNHYYNLFQREWRPDFDMTKHKCKLYYVESKIGDDTKRYLSEPIMHNYFDIERMSEEDYEQALKNPSKHLFSMILVDDSSLVVSTKYDDLKESGFYELHMDQMYFSKTQYKWYFHQYLLEFRFMIVQHMIWMNEPYPQAPDDSGFSLPRSAHIYNRKSWFPPGTISVSLGHLFHTIKTHPLGNIHMENIKIALAIQMLLAMNKLGDKAPTNYHQNHNISQWDSEDYYFTNSFATEYLDRLLWVILEFSVSESMTSSTSSFGDKMPKNFLTEPNRMTNSMFNKSEYAESDFMGRRFPFMKTATFVDGENGSESKVSKKDDIVSVLKGKALLFCSLDHKGMPEQIPIFVNHETEVTPPHVIHVVSGFDERLKCKTFSTPLRTDKRGFIEASTGGGSPIQKYLRLETPRERDDFARLNPASYGYAIVNPKPRPVPHIMQFPRYRSTEILKSFQREYHQVHRDGEHPVEFMRVQIKPKPMGASGKPYLIMHNHDAFSCLDQIQSLAPSECGHYFDFATLMESEGLVPKSRDYLNFCKFNYLASPEKCFPRVLVINLSSTSGGGPVKFEDTPDNKYVDSLSFDEKSELAKDILSYCNHRTVVVLIVDPKQEYPQYLFDNTDNIFVLYASEELRNNLKDSKPSLETLNFVYGNSWTKRNIIRYIKMIGKYDYIHGKSPLDSNESFSFSSIQRGSYGHGLKGDLYSAGGRASNAERFVKLSSKIARLCNDASVSTGGEVGFVYPKVVSNYTKPATLDSDDLRHMFEKVNQWIVSTPKVPDEMSLKLYCLVPLRKETTFDDFPKFISYVTTAIRSGYTVYMNDEVPRSFTTLPGRPREFRWDSPPFVVDDYRHGNPKKDDGYTRRGYINEIAYSNVLSEGKDYHPGIYQAIMFMTEDELIVQEDKESKDYFDHKDHAETVGSTHYKRLQYTRIPVMSVCFLEEAVRKNRSDSHMEDVKAYWQARVDSHGGHGYYGYLVIYKSDKFQVGELVTKRQGYDTLDTRRTMNDKMLSSAYELDNLKAVLRKIIHEGTSRGYNSYSGVHPVSLQRIRVAEVYSDNLKDFIVGGVGSAVNHREFDPVKKSILDNEIKHYLDLGELQLSLEKTHDDFFKVVEIPKHHYVSANLLITESHKSRYDRFMPLEHSEDSLHLFHSSGMSNFTEQTRLSPPPDYNNSYAKTFGNRPGEYVSVIREATKKLFIEKHRIHLGLTPKNILIHPTRKKLVIAGLECVALINSTHELFPFPYDESGPKAEDRLMIPFYSPESLPPEFISQVVNDVNRIDPSVKYPVVIDVSRMKFPMGPYQTQMWFVGVLSLHLLKTQGKSFSDWIQWFDKGLPYGLTEHEMKHGYSRQDRDIQATMIEWANNASSAENLYNFIAERAGKGYFFGKTSDCQKYLCTDPSLRKDE